MLWSEILHASRLHVHCQPAKSQPMIHLSRDIAGLRYFLAPFGFLTEQIFLISFSLPFLFNCQVTVFFWARQEHEPVRTVSTVSTASHTHSEKKMQMNKRTKQSYFILKGS